MFVHVRSRFEQGSVCPPIIQVPNYEEHDCNYNNKRRWNNNDDKNNRNNKNSNNNNNNKTKTRTTRIKEEERRDVTDVSSASKMGHIVLHADMYIAMVHLTDMDPTPLPHQPMSLL